MKRVSLPGVAIGAIVDIVATFILTLPLTIYIMATLIVAGMPQDKIPAAVPNALMGSPVYFSLAWVLGGLCSMLGGYVSARIAKHDEILNGALASILCVGSGVYAVISGGAGEHLWAHLVNFLLSPTLAAIGGYLRLRQKMRRGA